MRHPKFIIALLPVLLMFALSLAQESRRQELKLKPVPMNEGPLGPAGYLILVPIDDRPAVGQFAQIIGSIADHRVITPPREMLGRFTTPGDPAIIVFLIIASRRMNSYGAWAVKVEDEEEKIKEKRDAPLIALLVPLLPLVLHLGLIWLVLSRLGLTAALDQLPEFIKTLLQSWGVVPAFLASAIMGAVITRPRETVQQLSSAAV